MISALSTLRPRDGDRIFDRDGSRRKLGMALASPRDGVTFRWRSLVEGVPILILRSDLMDSVPRVKLLLLGASLRESFSFRFLWITLCALSGVAALSQRQPDDVDHTFAGQPQ